MADVQVEIPNENLSYEQDGALVSPQEDGSVEINMDGAPTEAQDLSDGVFDANLAATMDKQDLTSMGHELHELITMDLNSRKDWENTYKRGLKLLGLKYEKRTEPWEHACGAFHPLMLESVIRFNAQAMTDIFPAAGPVKTEIIGDRNRDNENQGKRVQRDLNYLTTEKITGYRDETDMMLFNLPLAGTTFRKLGFDKRRKVPWAEYVLPEHVIIPYAAASLASTWRFTIELNKDENWYEAKVASGEFIDVDIHEQVLTSDDITEERDKAQGKTPVVNNREKSYRFYECHVDYYLKDDDLNTYQEPVPYLVTLDANSQKIVSIYRNWKKNDDAMERMISVVQHKYMPGFGPYGTGLINILGGLTESATSILRQLVDAGSLANLPAGYKTKTTRIVGKEDPLGPGEFRDVDVGMGTLKESFFPLPFGEPSTVLAALLGQIVDEGRRIGSVADMKITDMTGQNMPVGTTMAIIERSMKVMSAVQQRLYESFKNEFKVLADIVGSFMLEDPYPFELSPTEKKATRKEDYSSAVDIIPVADPQAATMAQKLMSLQAVITLSQSAPQIYNLKNVHRDMITVLGSDKADFYIPPDEDIQPRDPITENMDLLTNKPVKAGIAQDHDAHIAVHMAAAEDPKIQKMLTNNPAATSIMSAASAHVQEHLAFKYRADVEKMLGVPLPPPEEPLPQDVEYEISRLAASASDKLLQKNTAEARQEEILDAMEDPIVQNERRALDIKQEQTDNKQLNEAEKLKLEREKVQVDALMRVFREMSETERSTLQAELLLKTSVTEAQQKAAERAADLGKTQMAETTKRVLGLAKGVAGNKDKK